MQIARHFVIYGNCLEMNLEDSLEIKLFLYSRFTLPRSVGMALDMKLTTLTTLLSKGLIIKIIRLNMYASPL